LKLEVAKYFATFDGIIIEENYKTVKEAWDNTTASMNIKFVGSRDDKGSIKEFINFKLFNTHNH
jgi:hypothetical protein